MEKQRGPERLRNLAVCQVSHTHLSHTTNTIDYEYDMKIDCVTQIKTIPLSKVENSKASDFKINDQDTTKSGLVVTEGTKIEQTTTDSDTIITGCGMTDSEAWYGYNVTCASTQHSIAADNATTMTHGMAADDSSSSGRSKADSDLSTAVKVTIFDRSGNGSSMTVEENVTQDSMTVDRLAKGVAEKNQMGVNIKRTDVSVHDIDSPKTGPPKTVSEYDQTVIQLSKNIVHAKQTCTKTADDASTKGCSVSVANNTLPMKQRHMSIGDKQDHTAIHPCTSMTGHSNTPNLSRNAVMGVLLSIPFFLLSPASATTLDKPMNQQLPDACYQLFQDSGNDCPSYLMHVDFESKYKSFNQTCCDRYPGLDFHCQTDSDATGETRTKFGCMQTVDLGKTFRGTIVYSTTASTGPTFQKYKMSDSQWRATDKESWQETSAHSASERSKCDGTGEELLCKGGDGEDNLCTCRPGYRNTPNFAENCFEGFTTENTCPCEEIKCPPGMNIAQRAPLQKEVYCKGLTRGFEANKTYCERPPTTPAPITTVSGTGVPPTTPFSTTSHDKPENSTEKGSNGTEFGVGAWFGIVAAVVAFLLAFVLLPLVKYRTKLIKYIKCKFQAKETDVPERVQLHAESAL